MAGLAVATEFRPPRNPIRRFRFRWDSYAQRFDDLQDQWYMDPSNVPLHIAPLFQWVYTDQRNRVVDLGQNFKDIYYTKLSIGDDDEWHFMHALGRGSFGAVALFEQRDRNDDTVLDQVVVKTTRVRQDLAIDTHRADLPKEAALMGQTNDLVEEGMMYLRHFKCFTHNVTPYQWKYYFEYCPYGDLERLRVRYKAYGRYLPELFLWHVFYWLAIALREYSDFNSWRDISDEHWGEVVTNGYLLHCDIKLQNILLGPPDPSIAAPDKSMYPIPRFADLGLAEVQSPNLNTNRAFRLDKGTRAWQAPETRVSRMPPATDFYPFGSLPADPNANFRKGRHRVTSKANVWALGAVMWSLLSLREIHDLSDIVNDTLGGILEEPDPGECLIDDADFRLLDPTLYSVALRDLIRTCLFLDPADRPDEQDLIDQVTAGYDTHLDLLRREGFTEPSTPSAPNFPPTSSQTAPPPAGPTFHDAALSTRKYKVYYRANEIDSAPDNYTYTHPGLDTAWFNTHFIPDFPWLFPGWGKLWPDTMPTNISPPAHWPQGFRDALRGVTRRITRWRTDLDGARFQARLQQIYIQQQAQQQQQAGVGGAGGGQLGGDSALPSAPPAPPRAVRPPRNVDFSLAVPDPWAARPRRLPPLPGPRGDTDESTRETTSSDNDHDGGDADGDGDGDDDDDGGHGGDGAGDGRAHRAGVQRTGRNRNPARNVHPYHRDDRMRPPLGNGRLWR